MILGYNARKRADRISKPPVNSVLRKFLPFFAAPLLSCGGNDKNHNAGVPDLQHCMHDQRGCPSILTGQLMVALDSNTNIPIPVNVKDPETGATYTLFAYATTRASDSSTDYHLKFENPNGKGFPKEAEKHRVPL